MEILVKCSMFIWKYVCVIRKLFGGGDVVAYLAVCGAFNFYS